MARITWQNVAAPDLTETSRSQAIAARMIGTAADSIGSGLISLDDRNKDKASAGALSRAMEVQDVGEWDRLMKNGGLEALGISPDRATADLTDFVTGRKDTLQQRDSRDQKLAQDQFNYKEDQFQFGRTKVKAGRDDVAYDRQEEVYARNEEDRLRGEKAADIAFNVSKNKKVYNDEEARKIAVERAGGDRKLEDAVIAQLTGRSEAINRIDPNVTLSGETNELLGDLDNGLRGRQEEAALEFNAIPGLSDYATAIGNVGTEDPMGSLLDTVSGTLDNLDGEEKQKRFNETSGSMKKDFDTLKDEFGDLPDAVIVDILGKSYQDDGIFFTGDQLENALPEARKRLERINTIEARNAIRVRGNEVQSKMDEVASQRKTMDRLVTRLQKAHTRGDDAEILKVRGQLSELAKTLAPGSLIPANGAGTEAQFQRMLEEAAAQQGGDQVPPPAEGGEGASGPAALLGQSLTDVGQFGSIADPLGLLGGNEGNLGAEALRAAGAGVEDAQSGFNRFGKMLFDSAANLPQSLPNLINNGEFPENSYGDRLLNRFSGSNDNSNAPQAPQPGASNPGQAPGSNQTEQGQTLVDIERVIQSGSLPPEVNIQAEVILNALKSGRSPGSGEPLNEASKEMLQQRLRQLIQSAG